MCHLLNLIHHKSTDNNNTQGGKSDDFVACPIGHLLHNSMLRNGLIQELPHKQSESGGAHLLEHWVVRLLAEDIPSFAAVQVSVYS